MVSSTKISFARKVLGLLTLRDLQAYRYENRICRLRTCGSALCRHEVPMAIISQTEGGLGRSRSRGRKLR